MSTKIYEAYRLPNTDEARQLIFSDLKPIVSQAVTDVSAEWLADELLSSVDQYLLVAAGAMNAREHGRLGSRDFYKSPACAIQTELTKGARAALKTDTREHMEYDYEFSMGVFMDPEYIYVIPYAEKQQIKDVVSARMKAVGAEDFSYWDNSDQPDDISDEEWDLRADVWEKILDENLLLSVKPMSDLDIQVALSGVLGQPMIEEKLAAPNRDVEAMAWKIMRTNFVNEGLANLPEVRPRKRLSQIMQASISLSDDFDLLKTDPGYQLAHIDLVKQIQKVLPQSYMIEQLLNGDILPPLLENIEYQPMADDHVLRVPYTVDLDEVIHVIRLRARGVLQKETPTVGTLDDYVRVTYHEEGVGVAVREHEGTLIIRASDNALGEKLIEQIAKAFGGYLQYPKDNFRKSFSASIPAPQFFNALPEEEQVKLKLCEQVPALLKDENSQILSSLVDAGLKGVKAAPRRP